MKKKPDKLGFITIRHFYRANDTGKEIKRWSTVWGNTCKTHIWCTYYIQNRHLKLNSKKTTQLKNGPKIWTPDQGSTNSDKDEKMLNIICHWGNAELCVCVRTANMKQSVKVPAAGQYLEQHTLLFHYRQEYKMAQSSTCTPRYIPRFFEIICLHTHACTHTCTCF